MGIWFLSFSSSTLCQLRQWFPYRLKLAFGQVDPKSTGCAHLVLSLNYIPTINFITNKVLLMLALLFTFSFFFFLNQAERKCSMYWVFLKNPAKDNKLYSSIQNRGSEFRMQAYCGIWNFKMASKVPSTLEFSPCIIPYPRI